MNISDFDSALYSVEVVVRVSVSDVLPALPQDVNVSIRAIMSARIVTSDFVTKPLSAALSVFRFIVFSFP